MKKYLIMSLFAVALVGATGVAADEVTSANAVGYVKTGNMGGDEGYTKFYMVAHPFESMDGAPHSLTNVFANVPDGTTVAIWDRVEQEYNLYAKDLRGNWSTAAQSATIERGEGAFLRVPAAAPAFDVIMHGEVPAIDTPVGRGEGFTMAGFPYPVNVMLTNTVMAAEVPDGTTIAVWDGDEQEYNLYAKDLRGNWSTAAQEAELKPGQAFFIRSGDAPAGTWDEVKPYPWP